MALLFYLGGAAVEERHSRQLKFLIPLLLRQLVYCGASEVEEERHSRRLKFLIPLLLRQLVDCGAL